MSKRASWAVAAGVAMVEALKDQAGLCRWNYALRSLKTRVRAPSKLFRMSGAVERVSSVDALKKREAEKAENVMHLICWGPK